MALSAQPSNCIDGPSQLATLIDQLATGESLTPPTRAWLLDGVMAYARSADASLDCCLGLRLAGKPRLRTRLLRAERNAAIREALAHIALRDARVTSWGRCERLAEQVRRLLPVWTRQYRRVIDPPGDWLPWQVALFRAWRSGQPVPETARGLLNIANDTEGFSVQNVMTTLAATIAQGSRHDTEKQLV